MLAQSEAAAKSHWQAQCFCPWQLSITKTNSLDKEIRSIAADVAPTNQLPQSGTVSGPFGPMSVHSMVIHTTILADWNTKLKPSSSTSARAKNDGLDYFVKKHYPKE
jgi:hypothetical protein